MKRFLLSALSRIYRLMLVLYPARHRRSYGGLMEQLFRDRCRDAVGRGSWWALAGLGGRTVADLLATVPAEHFAELNQTMKTQNIDHLSIKLLAAAVLLAAVAAPATVNYGLAPVCLYLSTLALLARAAVEWRRPPNQWLRGILWMLAMLVMYGFIMPFWTQMNLRHGGAYPWVPAVDAGAMLLNAAVAAVRGVLGKYDRPKGGTTGGAEGGQLA